MPKYFLLLVFFIVSASANNDFKDLNASKVTENDLKLMQEFDNLAYELSDTELKSLDIEPIYQFIYTHKLLIIDYSLLEIDFKASAGIDYKYEAGSENKDYKKIGVTLAYPLYDKKTIKDIKNKKLEFRFKVLDEINNYSKLRDKKIALNRELKFNRLIQIKEKLQVKKGVKYLDDKLNTIEKILKLQNSILDTNSNLANARLKLLSYVKKPYQIKLLEMLK